MTTDELLEENHVLRSGCQQQNQIATKCVMMLDEAGMGKPDSPHGNTLIGMVMEACELLKALPADWRKDSSLETWFPLTAETHAARERKIKELEADRDRWKEMKWQDALRRPDELVEECDRIKSQFLSMEEYAVEQMDKITALEDERRAVAAQVNHLLNLDATYKAVCEKREKIPFKWGPQPERDMLQERANELAGEIMRTERRVIEGLKAFASERAAGVRSINAPPAEEKYND